MNYFFTMNNKAGCQPPNPDIMNFSKQVLLFCFCFLSISVFGQQKLSWKKHVKLAEELFEKAEYADAGEHYRAAWRQKTKKTELIYKAGECFGIIRDYANAADAYKHVKKMNNDYPKVGLKYAQALKQSGDFDNASHEFADFLANYQGSDKSEVARMVQNEIKGCALARKYANNVNSLDVEVTHLSEAINTPETEFAPLPFNDEILYYSSTMAQRAAIYRSKKSDGQWSKGKVPESFPKIENDHFCNGSLSPDQKRFYFTICKSVESWGGLTTVCNLYVTERAGRSWKAPEKLRDYINMAGSTTTHPYVVHQGNSEVLYFASNRPEGKGGMDIWYTTRDKNSTANDFSYPINAGSKVNTAGDEITPYYDNEKEVLYFASKGHPGVGGYDIFKAAGNKSHWTDAANMGVPYNSSADDFFYIKSPSGKTGYFVSNRLFGAQKITTTDEDIFSFTASTQKELFAAGGVYDKATGELLPNASVTIFQIEDDGNRREMMTNITPDGQYRFVLFPEKRYAIEARKDGFMRKSYDFSTEDFYKYEDYGQPIYIEAGEDSGNVVTASQPKYESPVVEKPVIKTPAVETPVANTPTQPTMENRPVKEKVMTEIKESVVKAETIVETPVYEAPAIEKPAYTPPSTKSWEETKTTTTKVEESTKTEDVIYRPLEEVASSSYTPPATTTYTTDPIASTTYTPTERTNTSPARNNPTSVSTTVNASIPAGTTYTTRGKGARDNYEIVTAAPRRMGEYYKIQLIAVKSFDANHSRYRPVENMGRLDTEYIVEKGLTRVLLAEYHSFSEAKNDLKKVRGNRNFERAYIIKYIDGERIGRVN